MKISITDTGSGIAQKFAQAIGGTVSGRFIYIPESKGSGYMTGFSWGPDLRMMIRNYHLKEDLLLERTNELAEGQEDIIFMLSGIFPAPALSTEQLLPESPNILICRHAVSSIITMPSNTIFGNVAIAISKAYLNQLFGGIDHPVVASVLASGKNFVLETGISSSIINTAAEMLQQPVPEILEKAYYKLKCEELLLHIFTILMQREVMPTSAMHIEDIKKVYAIKTQLLAHLDEAPNIAALARTAGMSEPKLRKLFKQTFGKAVFEYYQSARMQRAAQLIKEERRTVSEVGYQLGFTNLSHFSRVFQQHTGIKPKKYSAL